jgi:hypothetical protein
MALFAREQAKERREKMIIFRISQTSENIYVHKHDRLLETAAAVAVEIFLLLALFLLGSLLHRIDKFEPLVMCNHFDFRCCW